MEAFCAIRSAHFAAPLKVIFSTTRTRLAFPQKLFLCRARFADSGIDGSFTLKLVSPALLAAEKEEARAVLTLLLKKQGLSHIVAVRTINKSDLFIDHLVSKLHSVHKSRYLENNLGLVKQVISSMYKRNIQRLTQTYLTLSLQDIANSVQLNSAREAEMHVLQMIQDSEIFATINQKDGMVRFLEDPEQYKTCQMIEHIDSSIHRIMALSRKLIGMDENISRDPLFLAKVGRERQRFDFDDFDSVPQKFNI